MRKLFLSVFKLLVVFLPVYSVNAASLLYTPTGPTNELVIIDLDDDKIVGRIKELEGSHSIATSDKSAYLVAGSMQPRENGKIPQTHKPAAVSESEHQAHHGGSVSGNNKRQTMKSFVSIVHPGHGGVMRRIGVKSLTHHTAMSPNGEIAIAVHSGVGEISVIDLKKFEVIKTIATGRRPNYAIFAKNGKRLYVSNAGSGTVTEIATGSWKVTNNFKVGKEPEHMVMGLDNKILFTANKGSGTVSAVDLTSGKIMQTYAAGKKVHGIDISDDGRWLFTSSKGEGFISRIDLTTGNIKTAQLRPAPYHLTYIRGKNKLYVSSRKLPKIWVIDALTLSVNNSIDLGKGTAHQMVIREE